MVVKPKLWRDIFQRDKGYCKYCDYDLLSSFSAYWSATVDHIKHRSDNGQDTKDNLVLACSPCNGMLSRANKLTTIEERRAFVQKRREEEKHGYLEWCDELRT